MRLKEIDSQGYAQAYDGDTALPAGLSLILADAARSHLKAGDIETASRCLEEAERLLSLLPGVEIPTNVK